MRAAVVRRPGGPESISMEDLPAPRPGTGEVRLRVRATSVNRLDVWVRQGTYRVPLPHVLGADVAGEVAQDDGTGRWKEGQPVVAFPTLSCGTCPSCRRGRESLCPTVGIVGRERWGGYAEEAVLPAENLVPLPPTVPWETAGAFPLTFLTAEHALARAELLGGETLVVFGASGGVGCALVARGVRRGARVIAVTGSPQHVPALRVMGADEVLMRGASDLADRVQGLTRGHGADVVADPLGQLAVPAGLKALTRGGRYVLVGVTSGAQSELELRQFYNRQLTLLGGFLGDREEFLHLVQELGRGRLAPTLHEALPLAQAPTAHRHLDAPHLGKIVLLP